MNIRGYTTSNMCYKTFSKLDLYFKRTFLQDLIKMIETNILILRCYIYQYLFKILPLNVNVPNLCILCNAIFFLLAVEILRNPYDVPVDSYQAFKVKY